METGLVSVDRWTGWSEEYFLSHLHADHTQGLTSSWSRGPLYCSPITAILFPSWFPGFDLSLLRVLDLGSWTTLKLRSSDGGVGIQVVAIDANHCPGSVMFLFRDGFGSFLFTGDFRWELNTSRSNEARSIFRKALQDNVVNVLYLDNTYCNPKYDFPSRNAAAAQIVDIIVSHPSHDVIIGIDSLGKEELLIHISRTLDVKIWVWPERLQTMHLLGLDDIFTTDTNLTRVRAVPRYSFSIETLEKLNMICPTIGIMASGHPWKQKSAGGNSEFLGSVLTARCNRRKRSESCMRKDVDGISASVQKFHHYIYSVDYSDHSCFAEIREFLNLVKPCSMKGIVASSSCNIDPLHYFGRFRETSIHPKSLPSKPKNKGKCQQSLGAGYGSILLAGKVGQSKQRRVVAVLRSSFGDSIRRMKYDAKISEANSSD